MCDVDGLHAQTVAGARVHESGAHTVEHLDFGVEDADRGEVLCVLYVVSFRVVCAFPAIAVLTQPPSEFLDLAGASYAGQATTFA